MKIVRPTEITDAVLTASNVVETAPAAYAGGTVYALGDTVSVATGTARAVYTSLANGNVGNNPPASPLSWVLSGNTYATYAGGTTYALADIVIDPVAHRTYRSLQAANTGHSLTEVESVWWIDIGPTNKWAPFDEVLQTQCSNPVSIVQTFTLTDLADSVCLLNVYGVSARIVATDAIDGVVKDQTYDLIADVGAIDFWDWCFEPPARKNKLAVTDLPPYAGLTITVTVSEPGGNALLGECVIGKALEIGGTKFGASVGFDDYSRKARDSFGNLSVQEGAYSDNGDFTLWVDNTLIDYLHVLLASLRATPIVYLGSDDYSCTQTYGFFESWLITIPYATKSVATVKVQGLT